MVIHDGFSYHNNLAVISIVARLIAVVILILLFICNAILYKTVVVVSHPLGLYLICKQLHPWACPRVLCLQMIQTEWVCYN